MRIFRTHYRPGSQPVSKSGRLGEAWRHRCFGELLNLVKKVKQSLITLIYAALKKAKQRSVTIKRVASDRTACKLVEFFSAARLTVCGDLEIVLDLDTRISESSV